MNKHSYNPNHSADLTGKDFHLSLNCKDVPWKCFLCSLGHGTCAPSSQTPRILGTTLWRLLHLKTLVTWGLQSLITKLRNQRSSPASKNCDRKELAQDICHHLPTIPNYRIQSSIASGLTAGTLLLEPHLEGESPTTKKGDTLLITMSLGETRSNFVPARSS